MQANDAQWANRVQGIPHGTLGLALLFSFRSHWSVQVHYDKTLLEYVMKRNVYTCTSVLELRMFLMYWVFHFFEYVFNN